MRAAVTSAKWSSALAFAWCLIYMGQMNAENGRAWAEKTERDFADGLRQQGYTVSAGHHDWA